MKDDCPHRSDPMSASLNLLNFPRRAAASFNQTVQRTGASRFAQRQIERHRRLAPVADLCVRAPMRTLRIRKLANALIPNATPSELVTGAALTAVERLGERYGGLWVGGTVDISDDGVSFTPNGLNVAFHVGLAPVRIPLADIRSARREFGWVTGIVVVEHTHGEFRFRCFGARNIAARLSQCLKEP